MDPNYLQERSEVAETMRRLLFSGSVLIATASGQVDEKALGALGKLLGPGATPRTVDPVPVREHLAERIAHANEVVPPLRRAQVIRDLCTVARADNHTSAAEMQIIYELADAVGVDRSLVQRSVGAVPGLD
jgi:tellurite resistance protein